MIRDGARTIAAAIVTAGAVAYLVACGIRRDLKPTNVRRRPRTGPPC